MRASPSSAFAPGNFRRRDFLRLLDEAVHDTEPALPGKKQ